MTNLRSIDTSIFLCLIVFYTKIKGTKGLLLIIIIYFPITLSYLKNVTLKNLLTHFAT